MPLQERTPAEKEAVRNYRKQQRRASALASVQPPAASSLPNTAAVAHAAAVADTSSASHCSTASLPVAHEFNSAAISAATSTRMEPEEPFSTRDSFFRQCVRQFAANAVRGALGRPYKLFPDQQEALLQAVEQRVAREGAGATASAAGVLTASDRRLIRSILDIICTWPTYFPQLYATLPRKKARKAASASTAVHAPVGTSHAAAA